MPKAKEKTQLPLARRAQRLKKQTFNVCFFKAFGSKQLFWHLVKVGPDTQDLSELLRVWLELKSKDTYQELWAASKVKSEEVAEMKKQISLCRKQVMLCKKHSAVYDDAVAAHEEALRQWKALNRNMQHRGMHELLDVQQCSSAAFRSSRLHQCYKT